MKKKFNFCLLLSLCSISAFAQTKKINKNNSINPIHLSKEQKLKDSIEFAKFKQNHPQDFLNERLPIKLLNDGFVVEGFSTLIQIKDNHVFDSVYHNFIPGMPDTSTVSPFNDLKITDSKINIELFPLVPIMTGNDADSIEVTLQEPDLIINNKIGKLPVGDFNLKSRAIRISINGKILFDWKPLENFAKNACKFSERVMSFNVRLFGYSYGYAICDTNLELNDQLLIEIKNTKNNWMIDRYNITRIAVSPKVAAVGPSVNNQISDNKNEMFIRQKKTSILNQVKEN